MKFDVQTKRTKCNPQQLLLNKENTRPRMEEQVKWKRKNCEIERKWVMFRDQNAKIKCDRQFMCVKKNIERKGPSEV